MDMDGGASGDSNPGRKRGLPEIDPTLRATAAAAAGGTLAIWWPAFTLGAYGAIFFDAVMGIWAVAAAMLLSGLLLRSRRALPWAGWVALALPSTWIALAVLTPRTHGFRYLHYFEVVLTLAGAPALAWLMTRILLPEYAGLPALHRLRAIAVIIVVGVLAFLLGKFNYLFLTCADFDVSGNNTPPGCVQGLPFHLL
ncbi:hypothetical protein ACQP2T_19200 [Nonomuraea sp. CA-143628]|uniref:hypothetical protein n=1 Tax=Nonomuraea sp. CA-143628 TaxID=3239997 RepID=UPI003D8BA361